MTDQKSVEVEWKELLREWDLHRFISKFEENGWIYKDDWNEMTNDDMNEMEMKRGHQVHFKKKLKEYSQNNTTTNTTNNTNSNSNNNNTNNNQSGSSNANHVCECKYISKYGGISRVVKIPKYHPGTTCQCIYEYLGSTHHAVCFIHNKHPNLTYGHKMNDVKVPLYHPGTGCQCIYEYLGLIHRKCCAFYNY